MKFFDKWFYRKVRWCWHRASHQFPDVKNEQDYLDKQYKSITMGLEECDTVKPTRVDESTIDLERPIRFMVAAAEGGMIMEITTYDAKNDRRITKHHIISDEVEDKAAAIAKIVSWEFLRRPQ